MLFWPWRKKPTKRQVRKDVDEVWRKIEVLAAHPKVLEALPDPYSEHEE